MINPQFIYEDDTNQQQGHTTPLDGLIDDIGAEEIKAGAPIEKEVEKALDTQTELPKPDMETRTAALSSEIAKPLIKLSKDLFKVTDAPAPPPKKYTEMKNQEILEAMPDVEDPGNLSGRSASEFKDSDSWQINFDTLDNEDDVNGMIGEIAERMKDQTQEARGPVQRDEQVIGLAEDLGTDVAFVAEFLNSPANDFIAPEKILAARKMLNASAVKLKAMADKVNAQGGTKVTPEEMLAFKKQYAFHQQFMTQFMAKRANIGRSLRAFSIPTGSAQTQADAIESMLMNVHSGLDISKVAAQIAETDTVKGVHLMVQAQDSLFKKAGNVFIETFINSILSGIKTHVVNTSGSALMIGSNVVDSFVAARLGTKVNTVEERMIMDEWKAGLFGLQNGFQDALRIGWGVAKTAEPYGGVSKMENAGRKFISGEYLDIKGGAGTAVDIIGEIIRAPTERLMGGIDGFMKVLAERQALAQVAYRRANSEANAKGLNPQESLELLQHYMNNPTDDMLQEATDHSLHVTFQSPLGKLGRNIQTVAGHNPVTQYFMPFVKTPINLMKQGFLERTPLAMITKEYQEAIKAGGARAQMVKARMYVGSTVAMSAGMLAWNGQITGAGPDDPKQKKRLMESGWRPYSFRTQAEDGTVTYVSYQRTEPYSYILGTIADFSDVWKAKSAQQIGEDDQRYGERVMGAVITATSHATLDRSFLTGLQNIMEIMNQPSGGRVEYFVKTFGNTAAPYAGARRDIARMFDDTKRTTDSMLTEFKATVPLWNESLPPMLDAYGEVAEYEGVLNPWVVKAYKPTPIEEEVARLVRSVNKSPISKPNRVDNGIRMSTENYHDFVKLSRKKIELDGQTFTEALNEAISSEEYQMAIDENKVTILSNIRSRYDKAARIKLAQNSSSYLDRIIKRKTELNARQEAKLTGEDEDVVAAEFIDNFMSSIEDAEIDLRSEDNSDLWYNKTQ